MPSLVSRRGKLKRGLAASGDFYIIDDFRPHLSPRRQILRISAKRVLNPGKSLHFSSLQDSDVQVLRSTGTFNGGTFWSIFRQSFRRVQLPLPANAHGKLVETTTT